MAIKIKSSKNYYVTEVNIAAPARADIEEVNELVRQLETTGKTVIQYNGGNVLGINIEQKTKVSEAVDAKIRELLGLKTKKL